MMTENVAGATTEPRRATQPPLPYTGEDKPGESYKSGRVLKRRVKLPLASVRMDGDTQARVALSPETVQQYLREARDGSQFPPVIVFYDGSAHWVGDGFHRIEAAKLAGSTEIEAEVREGNARDAFLFGVTVNTAHGLPFTNEDKHRVVDRMLRDPEWGNWSDREIAKHCRVSNRFVSNLRGTLSASCVNGSQSECETVTVTRAGTTYQQRRKKRSRKAPKTQAQPAAATVPTPTSAELEPAPAIAAAVPGYPPDAEAAVAAVLTALSEVTNSPPPVDLRPLIVRLRACADELERIALRQSSTPAAAEATE